ncbi:MAG: acyltransferase family protein [Lachnospiraceae bacterium]|nr:acyltransferase family protein [Lachnospiraceae bacterium]
MDRIVKDRRSNLTTENKIENIEIKKKYNSIDVVKFIMAIAVIAIHTCPLVNCNNKNTLTIYNNIVNMAVPFFFLASGYLLSIKLSFPYNLNDMLIIKNFLYKIIKMYLCWMIIYTPLAIYHFISDNSSIIKAVLMYIRGLLFIGEQYNSWQLWYLLSTIYTIILIIILIKNKYLRWQGIEISIIISVIMISLNWLVEYEGTVPFIVLFRQLTYYFINNGRIFTGAIYIPIGMYIAHKKISRKINLTIFILGFIGNYFIENEIISTYLLIITSIGLFGIVESINLKDNALYPFLRNMSTIIYFIHMYVWSFYYKIIYRQKTYGINSFLITTIVSCIIACIYLIIKKRLLKIKQ